MTPIIVGLNPSRMRRRVKDGSLRKNTTTYWISKWVVDWGFTQMAFTNLSGDPEWDFKSPDNAMLRETLDQHKPIIALGAKVEKHLKKLGYDCVRMPHPSGANLQMNDKKWVAEQVTMVKERIDVETR